MHSGANIKQITTGHVAVREADRERVAGEKRIPNSKAKPLSHSPVRLNARKVRWVDVACNGVDLLARDIGHEILEELFKGGFILDVWVGEEEALIGVMSDDNFDSLVDLALRCQSNRLIGNEYAIHIWS